MLFLAFNLHSLVSKDRIKRDRDEHREIAVDIYLKPFTIQHFSRIKETPSLTFRHYECNAEKDKIVRHDAELFKSIFARVTRSRLTIIKPVSEHMLDTNALVRKRAEIIWMACLVNAPEMSA